MQESSNRLVRSLLDRYDLSKIDGDRAEVLRDREALLGGLIVEEHRIRRKDPNWGKISPGKSVLSGQLGKMPSARWTGLGKTYSKYWTSAESKHLRERPGRFTDLASAFEGISVGTRKKQLPSVVEDIDGPQFESQNLSRFVGSAAQYILYHYLYTQVAVSTFAGLQERSGIEDYSAQVMPMLHVKFFAQNAYAAFLELWKNTVPGPATLQLVCPPEFAVCSKMAPVGYPLPWLAWTTKKRIVAKADATKRGWLAGTSPNWRIEYGTPISKENIKLDDYIFDPSWGQVSVLFPDVLIGYNKTIRVGELKTSINGLDKSKTLQHHRQAVLQAVAVFCRVRAAGSTSNVYADFVHCQLPINKWECQITASSTKITLRVARKAMYWALIEGADGFKKNVSLKNPVFAGLFDVQGNVRWSTRTIEEWLNPVLLSLRTNYRPAKYKEIPLLQFLVTRDLPPGDEAQFAAEAAALTTTVIPAVWA